MENEHAQSVDEENKWFDLFKWGEGDGINFNYSFKYEIFYNNNKNLLQIPHRKWLNVSNAILVSPLR